MKNYTMIIILFGVAVSTFATPIPASTSQGSTKTMSVADIVAALQSSDWQTWCPVVTYLPKSSSSQEAVRTALIELLNKQIAIHEQWDIDDENGKNPQGLNDRFGGEGYEECVGVLSGLVAQFKDSRALKAIIYTGSSDDIRQFGENAIPTLIEMSSTVRSPEVQSVILKTLGDFADAGIRSAPLYEQAKNAVFAAADDKNEEIREAAAQHLYHFGRDAALKKLKEMSESDAYGFTRVTDSQKVYPIRDIAKQEIERLQNSKVP